MRVFLITLMLFSLVVTSNVTATNFNLIYNHTIPAGFNDVLGKIEITSVDYDLEYVNIFTDIPISNSFSDNDFPLIIGEDKTIDFSINVPTYTQARSFDSNIHIIYGEIITENYTAWNSSSNTTYQIEYETTIPNHYEINFNLTINESVVFNVTSGMNITANNGDNINFTLPINNTGNKIIDIDIESDSELLNLSKTIRIYPDSSKEVFVEIDIPLDIFPETYEWNISYESEGITHDTEMRLIVKDNTNPEGIINLPDTAEIFGSINIEVELSDNIEIYNHWIKVTNPEGNETIYEDVMGVTFDDIKFYEPYEIALFVNDTSNNGIVFTKEFNVTKKHIFVQEGGNLDFGKTKVGNVAEYDIAALYENVPIYVGLQNISNLAVDVFLCTEGACLSVIEGDQKKVERATYIKLQLSDYYEGSVSGTLNFSVPDYVELEYETIDFELEFISYSVPEPITTMLLEKYERSCWANDTGEYETSTYTCQEIFPIDIEPEGMITVVSQRMIDDIDSEHEKEIDFIQGTVNAQVWFISVLFLIIGGAISYIIYQIYIYPRWYRLWR